MTRVGDAEEEEGAAATGVYAVISDTTSARKDRSPPLLSGVKDGVVFVSTDGPAIPA